jgi:hypothetical protein
LPKGPPFLQALNKVTAASTNKRFFMLTVCILLDLAHSKRMPDSIIVHRYTGMMNANVAEINDLRPQPFWQLCLQIANFEGIKSG